MKRKVSVMLVAVLALGTSTGTRAGDAQASASELQKEVQKLRAENDTLKRENQTLRKLLLDRQNSAVPTTQPPQNLPPRVNAPAIHTPATQETGFWITISSGKRHNKGCRYYMNSRGHPCGANEGTPCKICGG